MNLDFSSQVHFLLALLPESVLVLTAIVVLVGDVFARSGQSGPSPAWVRWLSLIGLAGAAAANFWLGGLGPGPATQMIALDAFRILANYILIGVALMSLLFAFDYLDCEQLNIGEFYFLVLTATAGMMLMAASRDLIPLFVSLELMSLSVYILVGIRRHDPRSSEAALKYFLMGAFASAFLLYGIALLFGATGSTNLALVGLEVVSAVEQGNVLLAGGVVLLLIGFAFKISAVPFHMWTPDAYEGAPTPVTGFMAAGVKAAAFVALLRIVGVELSEAESTWRPVLWWLAILTMIVPNLVALAQDNVKRMLAYSSVAHAGYLLVGIVSANLLGRSASLFYLAIYSLMTLGAFAVVYQVVSAGESGDGYDAYAGLGWRRPALGALLTLCLLSLAGFPPTGGFIGKFYLLTAAVEAGETTLAVVLVLSSLVAYYYYLRVIWRMYFESGTGEQAQPERLGLAFRVAGAATALGILVAGLLPGPALSVAERAGASLQPGAEVSAVTPPAPVADAR
ncbi:MAG: NADH-quinone oxidoreductase subunit N [Gemmatimonadota bacterium]